jgi:hypothetical protein
LVSKTEGVLVKQSKDKKNTPKKLLPVEKAPSQTEDILNSILPPR